MNYKTQKQNLLNRIEKLSEYKEIDENIEFNLDSLKDEISNELQFNVLCTGEFSAGKSTFINRFFIKKDVLPTKATETTAKLTFIKYSKEEKIVIHYFDEKQEIINEIKDGILERYLAKDGEKIDNVNYVEVFLNSDILKEGVTIIDSPGLNAPENERVNLTNEFIPKADAVLYLISALQAWKGSEKDFLENKILNKDDLDKIFFLINYWDILDEEEGSDVLDFVQQQMNKSLEIVKRDLGEVSIPPIIPISAKTKYNFETLDKDLIEYLSSKKGIDILNQKIEKFETLKQKILKLLDKKVELFNQDKEKLKEELEKIQIELSNLKKEATQYKKTIYPKVEKIVNEWIFKLEDLYREFGNNIVKKIDRQQIKDINNLEDSIRKIIINQQNSLQRKLNNINKKFYREIEEIAEEEKANLNLEEYFIKKESGTIYELQKELKAEIVKNKMDDFLPEIATAGGVGMATIPMLLGTSSIAVLGALPILAGGLYLYFKKEKENISKNKILIEENIENFIDEKIIELNSKKDEIIDNVIDNIKSEILQTYEVKEKEYQNSIEKYESDNAEKLKQLKDEISKI